MARVDLLPQGIIKVTIDGHFTETDVESAIERIKELSPGAERSQHSVKVMVNLSGAKSATIGARTAAARAYRKQHLDRLAVVSDSLVARTMSRLVMRASGMLDRVRYFEDEASALAWLQEK